MTLLPVPAAPAEIVSLERAKAYAAEARSERTRKAYTSAFRTFIAWGDEQGLITLPARPEVVAAYVAYLADAGRKAATIDLHVAAIAAVHRAGGFEVPTGSEAVKATLRGVRRTLGTRQVRKAPVTAETLKKALRKVPDDLAGARDRALLLIGFYAIPPVEAVGYWPAVEPHLRRACERSDGGLSTDMLLAECRAGSAHLLLTCEDDTILATAVARFCRQADGCVTCELTAAGGGSLRSWQHVIPDFEAWARYLGASSVRLTGRPGWERVFRGYRRRPLVSLVKDL